MQDSGVGIDPDRLATLFRKTASAPGTNGERGMGVGLRLCRELSERNGGLLYVDSTQGKGSVFQLQLPKFYQQNFRGSTTITQSKT
ncbi:MAG: hypothetical protein EAZ91_26150 [Cytophagales bacterium]|nr:MAG: hypothetical protein EAZ91_26150 [Cytophagales bacterium]